VLTAMLYYVIYQATKLVILFQFAYLMHKSYKIQSQDIKNYKGCFKINFVIFALMLSALCFLAAVLIDFAITGKFFSNRELLCIAEYFNHDDVSVFRLVSLVEFTLFIIEGIIVFIVGVTLCYVVNKSFCKTISTNF